MAYDRVKHINSFITDCIQAKKANNMDDFAMGMEALLIYLTDISVDMKKPKVKKLFQRVFDNVDILADKDFNYSSNDEWWWRLADVRNGVIKTGLEKQ